MRRCRDAYVVVTPPPGLERNPALKGRAWSLAILGWSRYSLTDSSQNSLIFSWTIQF
jgi:hypothetical protein